MAERNFVYGKKINGEEFRIYYIEDKMTGKKRFFTIHEITNNPERIEELRRELASPNIEYRSKSGAFARTDKTGKQHIFETNPCTAVKAGTTILKLEGEEILKKAGDKLLDKVKGIKDSKITKPLIALIVSAGIVAGSVAFNFENWFDGNNSEIPQTESSISQIEQTIPEWKEDLDIGLSDDNVHENPELDYNDELEHQDNTPEYISPSYDNEIDTLEELENMSYTTYTEGGVRYIETEDAIEIAQSAYNMFVAALNEYNKNAPEGKKYNYDPSLYDPYDMLGRWMRESSHIVYVDYQNGESVKDAPDYENQCRGPVQIGQMAIDDSKKIVLDLFGEEIIKSEEDLYNFGLALLQSYCLNVRYNQIYNSLGLKNVTTNHLSAAYLHGAGGAYSGEKENCQYALDIEWFAHCFRKCADKIKSGEMLRVDFIYSQLCNEGLREEYFSSGVEREQ